MNNKGFFFFKFSDEQGMLSILEGSPWLMFNNMPLFLQRWRPGLTLTKNRHDKIPVWVKIYDLPLEVWSGDNLCIIASKLGIPLAFDSFTEEMCLEHKGRNAYARILIEMSADKEWKRNIDISTWDFVTNSAVIQSFDVEYAWMPSRCSHCKVFGHIDKVCMASMMGAKSMQNGGSGISKEDKGKNVIDDEGFTEFTNRKNKIIKDGEGTSNSMWKAANIGNQKNKGKSNFSRVGNKFRGQYGNKSGNGWGQNGNWNNKGVGHWNLEKNKKFEKMGSGQYNNNDQVNNGDKRQVTIKKNVNDMAEIKKSDKETDSSNKNSFEVLGLIDEEAIIGMEKDDKRDKIGVQFDDLNCTLSATDDNRLKYNEIHNMGISNEDLVMVNAEKKMDSKRNNDSSSISGLSQAFEVVNAKNHVISQ